MSSAFRFQIENEFHAQETKNKYGRDLRSNEHYLSSSENKAWKKDSGLYGIWTQDLCDTGAVLCQLS